MATISLTRNVHLNRQQSLELLQAHPTEQYYQAIKETQVTEIKPESQEQAFSWIQHAVQQQMLK